MRMTKEELKERYFPLWNDARHDIVAVNYGDDPLIIWSEAEYKENRKLTGTMANLKAVEAFIYTQNGDYRLYRTLIGEIYISAAGAVLNGSIGIKYGGKTYNITINNMYGKHGLDVIRLSRSHVTGFSNKDGVGSPSRYTKELNKETIEKVLALPLEDYGDSVQTFMEEARKIYAENPENHILEKLFSL